MQIHALFSCHADMIDVMGNPTYITHVASAIVVLERLCYAAMTCNRYVTSHTCKCGIVDYTGTETLTKDPTYVKFCVANLHVCSVATKRIPVLSSYVCSLSTSCVLDALLWVHM